MKAHGGLGTCSACMECDRTDALFALDLRYSSAETPLIPPQTDLE